ncbi:MAG TPA: uroporphyrinogen-III synthase [Phycisphaerae bacterium]|nr:uroporphyrinogen-III synthase [Phycisphaerae bacterium]
MDDTLTAFVERIGPFPKRTVCFIGLGPGDPGLLAVKGAVRLRQADVVFYDFGYHPSAIWNLLAPDAERVPVPGCGSSPTPAQIAETIRPHVEAGRRVVYLTGGNPFVFERADQVARALSGLGVAFEVVPGLTAALAAAAYAGVPLSAHGTTDAVSLAPGASDDEPDAVPPGLPPLARGGTLAVYVGERNLNRICDALRTGGLEGTTPAAIVEDATRTGQRVLSGTLDTIAAQAADAGVTSPALFFFGPRATVRPELNWFERRPLFGQRILVTRPWHQSAVLAGRLSALGADVIEAPTVTIEPPCDHGPMDDALGRLPDYHWLILTSANGADALADRMRHLGLDARALAAVRIAAIGPATADRLRTLFVEPDLVPDEFVAESLAQALGTTDLTGKRCLLLRSDIARKTLPEMLDAAGARCDDIPAYRTTIPDKLPDEIIRDLAAGAIQWATFTSSSTFANFVTLLGDRAPTVLPTLKLASIGPITSGTIRSAGYEPTVEAQTYTVEGLADAIAESGTSAP